MSNRLHLDWTIERDIDRSAFVAKLLETLPNPTDSEIEMMSKYILWGKDENGLSSVDRNEIQLESRGKSWNRNPSESLEALLESPTFNENIFSHAPTKVARQKFERSSVYKNAPSHLLEEFKTLWRQIDELDYSIWAYETSIGKHNRDVRPELESHLNEWGSDKSYLRSAAAKWTPLMYSRKRHELVDLYTDQYRLRDNYTRNFQPCVNVQHEEEPIPNSHIPLPLGLESDKYTGWAFCDVENLKPNLLSGRNMKGFWNRVGIIEKENNFDFRNEKHLEKLCKFYLELKGESEEGKSFIRTFEFYRKMAQLPPAVNMVINLKIVGLSNEEIREKVNKEFGMNYTVNYISTLYHLRGLQKIAEAAADHENVVMNLWVPENFKKCRTCGRLLLRTNSNFVKRSNAADGLSTQCKVCDKKKREEKANEAK